CDRNTLAATYVKRNLAPWRNKMQVCRLCLLTAPYNHHTTGTTKQGTKQMNARYGMFHHANDLENAVFYRKGAMRAHAKGSWDVKRQYVIAAKHWLAVAMLTRLNIRDRKLP